MKFFRLLDDMADKNRWHLLAVEGADNWRLARPPMFELNNLIRDQVFKVGLGRLGNALDFTLAGYASVPVLSFKALQSISGFGGFTAFPIKIDGFQQKTSYHVLHFWDEADCVDEKKSKFDKFQIDDPIRPDLAGNYCAFFELVVDPSRIGGKHIFRLARSGSEIIVSEEVKRCFEEAGVTGAIFLNVTGDQK